MDLRIISFKPTVIEITELSKLISGIFCRLINLDKVVDLDIKLRKKYQGEEVSEFIIGDKLFYIESVFLDRYLQLQYGLDEYWQYYGFSKPAYFLSFLDLKGGYNCQLAFATSVAIACAEIIKSDRLYSGRLWSGLMQPTDSLDFVLIKDVLEKASNPKTQPLTDESYRIFNARALDAK